MLYNSSMVHPLDKLEASLRALIENSADILPWNQPDQQLVHYLIQAINANLTSDVHGRWIAPSTYTIYLNADNTIAWQAHSPALHELARSLEQSLIENGIAFNDDLQLRILIDPNLAADQLRVEASAPLQETGQTTAIPTSSISSLPEIPPGACLITPDDVVFPLNATVINIGRRADNHLVIDDPRVSRTHAQLRAIQGHYLVFDLNSTGGTYVNGERITQLLLRPGDVISLSGIPLIYDEETTLEP